MGRINEYDVFLSHNSADKEAVENIAQRLHQEAKLQPFLDKWHLIPGEPWQEGLEEALDQSRTCAVFLGPSGLGPWENEEMRGALDQRVHNKSFRVIPVLLPGTNLKGKTILPRFLHRLTWVDFRHGLEDKEAFQRLICGIQGIPLEPVEPQHTNKPTLSIWNVPYRQNPYFTGRKKLLETLHQTLTTEHTTALTQPQAITGLGGIGKTQTAIEYAYQHRKDYQIIWWLRAEEPTTLATDYAQLAIKLDLPEHEATKQAIQIQAVRNWLEQHDNWLLILDNAEERHNIHLYVPQTGNGHVLITSRNPIWDGLGTTLTVEVMQPEEALDFLAKRTNDPNAQAAKKLAKTLGYLPLALEQAAAYIRENSISLDQYQTLFQKYHAQLLQHSHLATEYPDTVATTWELSFQKVQEASPVAVDFLNFCAFLASDAIFLDMITKGAIYLPNRLAKTITDPLTLNQLINPLLHYSLVQREGNTLTIHRLVQGVLRDRLNFTMQRYWAERAVQIVNQAFPEPKFSNWNRCKQLLPHAQICTRWINEWEIVSKEAGQLLDRTGSYLRKRAAYTEAEPLLQQAFTITEETLGPNYPELATILDNLANLYHAQGRHTEAELLFQRALVIYEKTLGSEHPELANVLGNLANLYTHQGRYAEAEPLYQKDLTIKKKTLGPGHPSLADTLNNLALLYAEQGRYTEAELLYKQTLTIREKALGPGHPDLAGALNNLALLYAEQGRYAEAEPLYQQALAIKEKTLGADHPELANTPHNLALLYAEQGRYAEAEPLCKRALVIWEKTLGPDHPNVASALNNLADLYRDQARYTEAESLYQRAQIIREKALGPDHPDLAITLHNLAKLYTNQGCYAEAEPLYQQALVIYEKALGPNHPKLAIALENYASLLHEAGQDIKATTLETHAQTIRSRHAEKNPTN